MWEATGRRLFTLPAKIDNGPLVFGEQNKEGVFDADLSPDGRLIAAGVESSGDLSVFEVDTGTRVYRAQVFRGLLYDIKFTPNGRTVLLLSSDTLVRELDAKTGKPVSPSLRHPSFARTMGVALDGTRVVTICNDSLVRVWDFRTGDVLFSTPVFGHSWPNRCWFSRDGMTIQIGSGEQYWRVRHRPTQGRRRSFRWRCG